MFSQLARCSKKQIAPSPWSQLLKKGVQAGKGEVFLNATDIFNTMRIRKEVRGANFDLTSVDYYETQVVRAGYTYKFWKQLATHE